MDRFEASMTRVEAKIDAILDGVESSMNRLESTFGKGIAPWLSTS